MRFLLYIFLLLGALPAHTAGSLQNPAIKKMEVSTDSTKVALRKFDEKKLKAYSKERDFMYDDAAPQSQSLWSRFWQWFWKMINNVLSNEVSGGLIKYMIITGLIVLAVFIILKIIGADLKLFARRSTVIDVPYHESEDNIHEINFNDEIEKAISSANYRLAVRLLYLRVLKKLSDSELIRWQPEKTNQTYISEITDADRKREFGGLTHQFEYVWYGEFFIDKENFNGIKNTFDQFYLHI